MSQPELWPYPEIGKIAVTQSGARIVIWPDEGDEPQCFTGQLLEEGASAACIAVHNVSVLWRRDAIIKIDEPTAHDRALSIVDLEATLQPKAREE